MNSITDKQNGHILGITGSANPGTLPLLQSGLNKFGSGINFIRIRSSGVSDRSSLAGSGLVFNINEPIDLFFVMRFGQNIPSPFSSTKRYMNWGIIISGDGVFGTNIPNQAELTSAYQFPFGSSGTMRFFIGSRSSNTPCFQTDFSNVFQTGSFTILNWVHNGDTGTLSDGLGINSQVFLFNNVPGVLSSYPKSSIPTGLNRLDTIGYTGRQAFGSSPNSADVVQDYSFGERIVFNRVLTPIERQFVFDYLSGKWGV